MKTRVDRNLNEGSESPLKRVNKNTSLYEEIKNSEVEAFDIPSNARVIGDNNSQMDIDKIKEILEKNYQEPPKRRKIALDIPEEEELEMEKTREYNINTILENAREEKEVDYEQERLKKVRDTQYDILKNLELEAKEKTNNEKNKEELLELINTINLNEYKNKEKEPVLEEEELNPLNILSDLKGDENTVVVGAKEMSEEVKPLEETKDELDDSFYSDSMSFSKKDFADLDSDKDGLGFVVKILIFIVMVAIIGGIVLFLNEFLGLNWF